MKKITKIAGEVGAKLRDRSRSVKLRVLDIARRRAQRPSRAGKTQTCLWPVADSTSRVVGQAKRFSAEIGAGAKRSTDLLEQLVLDKLRHELDAMGAARAAGDEQTGRASFVATRVARQALSLFEPTTE